MKVVVVILSFFPFFFGVVAQNLWVKKDSVNGPGKSVMCSFVLNGNGFVLAGLDDIAFKRKMYSYNPIQDDWDDETSLGGENADGLERGSATAFSVGNKGYVCLGQGQSNPYFKDLWEYNDETKTWSQKADFIGSARSQAVGFAIGDFAYVGTGQDLTGLTNDFYKYNSLTNQWTAISPFPGTPRRQAVGFAMGSQGYVGTGDDGVMKKDFWQYEPATDTWSAKADFPGTARAGATGWGIFPSAFIATGEDLNFNLKKDVWEFNYFSNSWVQRADFSSSPRKNAISFVIGGIAYLGTGYDGTFVDDFYAYSPILGIEENPSAIESVIFPNPTQSTCEIHLKKGGAIDKLEIYTIVGQNVTGQVEMQKMEQGWKLNVSQLAKGNYIYKITNQSSTKISGGKFIRY